MRFFFTMLALFAGVLFAYAQPGAAGALPSPAPVRVAVIDSGVARTPEMQGVLVEEYDMAAFPARQAFHPRYSHGTMVATVLMREARHPIAIVSLRIDDPAGCPEGVAPPCQGSAEPVVAAIDKAVELRVAAINISLSLKDDPAIAAAVRRAARAGIPVIMAAGNEGRDRPANLRAARAGYPRAVLVGALDARGQPWEGTNRPEQQPSGYLYAWQPGVGVPTVLLDGRAVEATGTSFAAPIQTARILDLQAMSSAAASGTATLVTSG